MTQAWWRVRIGRWASVREAGAWGYFGSNRRSSSCGEIEMLVGPGVVVEGFGEIWVEGVRDFDNCRPQTNGMILEEARDPRNCPLGRLGVELVEALPDPSEGSLL